MNTTAAANPSTPVDPAHYPPYVEQNFEINYYLAILESFLLILMAELGDKTFIMNIILQLRTNKITIFFASSSGQILMNVIAVIIGFAIKYCLYKNLVDYFCIMFFVIYGITLLGDSFNETSRSFEQELRDIEAKDNESKNILPPPEPKKMKLSVIQETDPSLEDSQRIETNLQFGKNGSKEEEINTGMSEKNKEIIEVNEDEEKNDDEDILEEFRFNFESKKKVDLEKKNIDTKIFWTIFRSMALTEFGDRTQICAMMMSSTFNVSGVLIGSCTALLCSSFLGVYYGRRFLKLLNEKVIYFLLSVIFITYGVQIYIGKKNYVIA